MKILLHTFIYQIIAIASIGLAAPVHLLDESPVSIKRLSPDVILIDFGQVAFGNIQLTPAANATQQVTVHFGEDLQDGRINRKPPGTVRYAMTQIQLKKRMTSLK